LSGTGSVGFTTTSSFLAVSSSQQQVSASYIALSASYNTFSGSASTRITANSSSIQQVSSSQQQISSSQQQISSSLLNVISIFATTGSNSFRANQSITGSLVVSSTITAQTLVVQTVTSSIVYSSGSNIFGCDLNSRQTFTGSVLITGSLTIAGASSATSYSGVTIYGSTVVCSAVGLFSGCVGIGTVSPGARLEVVATGENVLKLKNSGGQPSLVRFNDTSTTLDPYIGSYGNDLAFGTYGGGEKMRITSTGVACFLSTVCSPAFVGGTMSGTTIYGSTAVCSAVGKFSTCIDAGSGYFSGNVTAVRGFFNSGGNATDPIISVTGDTNTGLFFPSADTIATTTGGTERMRITSAGIACFASTVCAPAAIFTGCVGIGITSPTTKLDVYAGACTSAILWGQTIRNEGNAATTEYGIGLKLKISGDGVPNEVYKWAGITAVAGTNYSNRTDLAFYTNTASTVDATEKVRITGDGNVGIGVTVPYAKLHVAGTIYSNVRCNTIDTDDGISNNFQGYGGYWALRTDESNRFNLDVYNSGTPITALQLSLAGAACFSSTVCAPIITSNAGSLSLTGTSLLITLATESALYIITAQPEAGSGTSAAALITSRSNQNPSVQTIVSSSSLSFVTSGYSICLCSNLGYAISAKWGMIRLA